MCYYLYYDSSTDYSKAGVIKTNRNIYLGDSKEKVIGEYGEASTNIFNAQSSYMFKQLSAESPREAEIMKSQCSTYLSYSYGYSGAIEFYFDDNNLLSWIVFYAYF